jgi:outer membrane protein assembly factor BamD
LYLKKILSGMKKLLLLLIPFIIAGCSSSFDTTNLSPAERLTYAQELYNDEDYLEAITEFQNIVLQYPGNAVVDDAQYYLGMTRYKRGEYILSAFEFSKLIKTMPASELVPEAQYMLAQSYYELSPVYSLDQTYTRKAIEEFQAFIDFFPANDRVAEAEKKINDLNTKLAEKEFSNAVIYHKMEYYNAALIYYNNVSELYHDTRFAPTALYNRIKLLIQRNRTRDAVTDIDKFLQRYPDSNNVRELQALKGTLESKLSASK